jgi:phosphoribosylformylglycinamidine synthase
MDNKVMRVFVEKKPGANGQAASLLQDLKENLGLSGLKGLRIAVRYDAQGMSQEEFDTACRQIFGELAVDYVYQEVLPLAADEQAIAVEYLPGQYDQRADSAAACIQLLTQKERPLIRTANVYILQGDLSKEEMAAFKKYCINPVDSREAALDKPETLMVKDPVPADVARLAGFRQLDHEGLTKLHQDMGLSMSLADLAFCQEYFQQEQRDPSITEMRVIDTYWSDHCRHTTFHTIIEDITINEGQYKPALEAALTSYLNLRQKVHGSKKPLCLMDMATINAKALSQEGKLEDLDASEEINACSIKVEAEVLKNGRLEKIPYLVMFKNETHNHPTEIEPFGGAATCIGGAIRDPLSGRSYVYQAMRVTGSANPLERIEDTLPGKLPQRTITRQAAHGYSSYGNQIGLATGLVDEVYHEGYKAKRMEIGAVVGAAPAENVVRTRPESGDLVLLLGGRTGRDGCGGATGSSKAHHEDSIETSGAEVQKGNALTERKLQRLYRNPQFTTLVKRCNDFGAGGVSVAIGELTDSLDIDLDAVPKKYEGLDGTELAISESQERMAIVIAKKDLESVLALAAEENLEATVVATVAEHGRLRMHWRGQQVVDLSREFLNTSGVRQKARAVIAQPASARYIDQTVPAEKDIAKAWTQVMGDLNVCSKKGLIQQFDSTIGTATVLMPLGGKRQETPAQAMVAKLPVLEGEAATGTWMSYGLDPALCQWSPYHGALYAVVDALTKLAAAGSNPLQSRMSFQEYFERLGEEPQRWGKPLAALLGAQTAMAALEVPAIGGKDSMSGSFNDLHVPPTLCAFALATDCVSKALSPEFKKPDSLLFWLSVPVDAQYLPDFAIIRKNFNFMLEQREKLLAATAVGKGGLGAAIAKAAFGNDLGVILEGSWSVEEMFKPGYGGLLIEVKEEQAAALLEDAQKAGLFIKRLGLVQSEPVISLKDMGNLNITLSSLRRSWEGTLEPVFPTNLKEKVNFEFKPSHKQLYTQRNLSKPQVKIARPRICIPVFPGTNCEYDTAAAFSKAGGKPETIVLRNLTPQEVEQSSRVLEKAIDQAQIIMIPGGFSGGDEPDGSGKLIATTFRNPRIKEAVYRLLRQRDGLILGICNGFQALIKLGLVPYGEIRDMTKDSPTLTFNAIGRHNSGLWQTRITSTLSPWLMNTEAGEIYTIPISHGEGRIHAAQAEIDRWFSQGQVAAQYVDEQNQPSMDIRFNPNGSLAAIESLTSPDGRVLGKMGHSERIGQCLYQNVPGNMDQKIFASGIQYFS